jgi:hypothetical protein
LVPESILPDRPIHDVLVAGADDHPEKLPKLDEPQLAVEYPVSQFLGFGFEDDCHVLEPVVRFDDLVLPDLGGIVEDYQLCRAFSEHPLECLYLETECCDEYRFNLIAEIFLGFGDFLVE